MQAVAPAAAAVLLVLLAAFLCTLWSLEAQAWRGGRPGCGLLLQLQALRLPGELVASQAELG